MSFDVGATVNIYKGDNKGNSGTITRSTPNTAQVKLTSGPNKGRTVKIYTTSAEVVQTKQHVESPVRPSSPVTSHPSWEVKRDECYYEANEGLVIGDTVKVISRDSKYFNRSGSVMAVTGKDVRVALFASGTSDVALVTKHQSELRRVEGSARVLFPKNTLGHDSSSESNDSRVDNDLFVIGGRVKVVDGHYSGKYGIVTAMTPDKATVLMDDEDVGVLILDKDDIKVKRGKVDWKSMSASMRTSGRLEAETLVQLKTLNALILAGVAMKSKGKSPWVDAASPFASFSTMHLD
eukprot:Nitzschia sp. Nitz4//scaffold96_size78090//73882//74760//NITZ4_005509-RA/size78090-processed-gene-0.130-mRNA-1//-1//CDS//3329560618//6842//frame0